MSTSPKTLEQVRSILGKLDQRIDALRSRRVHGEPMPAAAGAPGATPITGGVIGTVNGSALINGSTLIGVPRGEQGAGAASVNGNGVIGNVTPAAAAAVAAAPVAPARTGHPKYGRATPLRNVG
ncbi:hypothetical protein BH11PLA1_BH11PLA1_11220 [soil metagenome]